MSKVYLALIHYPIYNKNMEVIATSVTNLDIHDIARSSRTYGIENYFIVHPYETQQNLTKEIIGYWQDGYGSQYNSDRKEAFSKIKLASSLAETVQLITEECGQKPRLITTDARVYPNTISYQSLRYSIENEQEPYLLLFGTGWGIEKETMLSADFILEPIYGPSDYNHLSVRSAVAIILDRLLGENWWDVKL